MSNIHLTPCHTQEDYCVVAFMYIHRLVSLAVLNKHLVLLAASKWARTYLRQAVRLCKILEVVLL
jgi:hypothetical protein